ncbi:MAG: hypothetical protein AAB225_10870 [Acidobacteriota bacterium]
MVRDSLVEEVRAIREAFAKEHRYDLKAIVHALQRGGSRERAAACLLAAKEGTEGAAAAEGRVALRPEGVRHAVVPGRAAPDGILGTRTSGQGARELQLTLRVSW